MGARVGEGKTVGDEQQLSQIVGGEGASAETVRGEAGASGISCGPGAVSPRTGCGITDSAGEVGDGVSPIS